MSRVLCLLATLLLIGTGSAKPPNVLLIMADDLGFSDLGCYGGEIQTPNLDRLAANGLRYTQFYNTARCWPTRAALLTGYYAQQVRRDAFPSKKRPNQGRPEWAPLLPAHLSKAGYRSYHSGKWHLDGKPLQTGFHHSYYLRDQGRFFSPKVHWKDDVKLPEVRRGTGFYGTIAIADAAIEHLKAHAAKHADSPFFQYIGFTAPHFPLHALPEDIAKCLPRYKVGWDVIRAQRWKRLQKIGFIKGELSPVERDLGPPYHFPDHLKILGEVEVNRPIPWKNLTADQKVFQQHKMAIHAAMIERMDHEIGRILTQLKAMNAIENTLVMFLSDNGASAEIMVRTDGHDRSAPLGSAASYLCLGPGWSTACNTPFRRHKTWVHEGGSATPFIAHWPQKIRSRGALRQSPSHVIDVVPTILQLADIEAKPQVPFAGQSLTPTFQGKEPKPDSRLLWWLHDDHRALRHGDWKVVAAKGQPWELFDLSKDRTESHNLAETYPKLVEELASQWQSMTWEFSKVANAKPSKK